MKQKITATVKFSDLSRILQMKNVYQKGNTLVAVSEVLNTDNMGDAICIRNTSQTVMTHAESELAVKHILINRTNKNIPNIGNNYSVVSPNAILAEITGLEPLQIIPSSPQAFFANQSGGKDIACEDDYSFSC